MTLSSRLLAALCAAAALLPQQACLESPDTRPTALYFTEDHFLVHPDVDAEPEIPSPSQQMDVRLDIEIPNLLAIASGRVLIGSFPEEVDTWSDTRFFWGSSNDPPHTGSIYTLIRPEDSRIEMSVNDFFTVRRMQLRLEHDTDRIEVYRRDPTQFPWELANDEDWELVGSLQGQPISGIHEPPNAPWSIMRRLSGSGDLAFTLYGFRIEIDYRLRSSWQGEAAAIDLEDDSLLDAQGLVWHWRGAALDPRIEDATPLSP